VTLVFQKEMKITFQRAAFQTLNAAGNEARAYSGHISALMFCAFLLRNSE